MLLILRSRTGDRKGHLTGHVTFTYQVTRERYGTNFDCFEFLDPKNGRNKKNHLSSSTTTKVSNSSVSRSGLDLWRSPKVTDGSEDADLVPKNKEFLGHEIVGVKKIKILQWKLPKLWIYWGGGGVTRKVILNKVTLRRLTLFLDYNIYLRSMSLRFIDVPYCVLKETFESKEVFF